MINHQSNLELKKVDKEKALLIDTNVIDLFKKDPSKINGFCTKVNRIEAEVFISRRLLDEIAGEKSFKNAPKSSVYENNSFQRLSIIKEIKKSSPLYFLRDPQKLILYEIEGDGVSKKVPIFSEDWIEVFFNNSINAREYILKTSKAYNQRKPQMEIERDISKDGINKIKQTHELPYTIDDKIYNDFIKNGFKKESQYFDVHVRSLVFYLYRTFTYCFEEKVTEEEFVRYSAFSEVIKKSILENKEKYPRIRASFIISYCRQLKWTRLLYKQSLMDNELTDHLFLGFALFVNFFITNDGKLQNKCNELRSILPISVISFNDWVNI